MEVLTLDGMPRPLVRCTPSRLATWQDCPRRYRMTYLDRPAPARGAPWAHSSFGATVHNALRAWWELPVARRTPEVARSLVDRCWLSDGYRDAEQQAAHRERARDLVERYVATLDPADEPVGVERTVSTRTGRLVLSGRVDRIDRRGDELVIVDYKTGRTEPTGDDVRGSRALGLYAYSAERVFRRRCRRVELHHLPTGTVAAHEHTEESLARHLRRAEATADDILAAEAALAGGADPDVAFPTAPGPVCGWCDYRRACPAGAAAPTRQPWEALEPRRPAD
jgi:RecB family exonuclease